MGTRDNGPEYPTRRVYEWSSAVFYHSRAGIPNHYAHVAYEKCTTRRHMYAGNGMQLEVSAAQVIS